MPTVPVKLLALRMRINRAYAKRNKNFWVKYARTAAEKKALGDFYVVDMDHSSVKHHHVDLEQLAAKLGVIESWERLEVQR